MRLILVTLLCCATAGLAAPVALGQARLASSVPEPEAVIASSPERLSLRFSDRVTFGEDGIEVLDGRGRSIDVRTTNGTGKRLDVALPRQLPEGSYAVGWRVTDEQGSPVTGALNFHVGAAPTQPAVPAAAGATRTASDELRDLARAALIVAALALLLAAGVFLARRRRPEASYAMAAGQSAALCVAVAGAGLLIIGGENAEAPPAAPGTHSARLASGGTIKTSITPPRVGAPRVLVDVSGPGGQPDFGLDRVIARLTPADRRLGPFTIALPKRKVGRFEPDLLTFPFPGRWRVELSLDRGKPNPERVVFDQEISR